MIIHFFVHKTTSEIFKQLIVKATHTSTVFRSTKHHVLVGTVISRGFSSRHNRARMTRPSRAVVGR